MKNVLWIFFIYTLVFNLNTVTYCIKNKDELNVNLSLSNSSTLGTSDNQALDAVQTNNDNDDFELEDNIDEASSEIVESQVPFPTDKPSEIESEVLVRKPRRKRRRRRKRPRTSTHTYEENINHPVVLNQEPLESDYVEGYVRRRPIKRRRRPLQRRPLIEDPLHPGTGEEENILPRRKLIRRPADFGNRTSSEDEKRWEPITSTEEGKWKIVKTTETTNIVSTITPKSTTIIATTATTPKTTTISPTLSTYRFTDNNSKINHGDVGSLKKSNSSRADIIVLHKRPINSNLPPTSAVIRRRLKPQNMTLEEITTIKPKITIIKEELPLSLLPPDFKITEYAPPKESKNSTDDYQFNDEALTKIIKEQPSNKNDEFKFKSDSIPKVKDEILSLLKTKTGSSLLSNVLNLRNMSLEELLQHRERGSSQRHQELLDTKEESIDISADEPIITENTKNFTNYLIETKRLAQKSKVTLQAEELNDLKHFKDNNTDNPTQTSTKSTHLDEENNDNQYKNTTNEQISKHTQEIQIDDIKSSIQISKEKTYDHEVTNFSKPSTNIEHLKVEKVEQEAEIGKIKLDTIFEEKKVFSFPTTTTYTTVDVNYQENEATSFVSKTPKTRIIMETSEREPRLFDSMPDFSIKTTQRPLITPTIPSQVLFIQDTNHLDKYQSYSEKNKDINEENNLEYRRFEMRKLPVAVKSAIIASAAILAIAVLGFFVLLISCRMRQKKRVLRKKSVFCQHNLHHDPDLRSSARSTSPVMDKHCQDLAQDQYFDGYGGRIDARTTANRQYYLWRTLRKTFRYD